MTKDNLGFNSGFDAITDDGVVWEDILKNFDGQTIHNTVDNDTNSAKYTEKDVDSCIAAEHQRLFQILDDKPIKICKALGFHIWSTGNVYSIGSREYFVQFPDGYKTVIWSPIWSELTYYEEQKACCLEVLLQWAEQIHKDTDMSPEENEKIVAKTEKYVLQSDNAEYVIKFV